ncbi:non-specific lipid transfer protein GPI-anchored 1 [Dendrobium catenatum]|uniref:Putative GPI-anchored protein n=1 Tax=Dendrobium catenatum TaxID=906689 RepID=A0A2I0WSU3_9ASPA|nr:non-specific lipid transfer protein GPI-anchored 1 [Dendrobium catenatum]PKU78726.1 putative GPI-anchored protein [Dendrobium catenatum]
MAGIHRVVSLLFLVMFVAVATSTDAPTVDQQCATEASKLTECLGYASGQDKSPTGKCCGSVTDIKGKDPTCLCLVIRQAHGGGGGFSAFHLRLDRLLTLPKACALANASVSDCPKLLNLPPNSPDYAIFTNASYANSSTTPSATTEYPSEAAMKLSCSSFLMIALSAVFFLFFQIGA